MKIKTILLMILINQLSALNCFARYRVYQIEIKNNLNNEVYQVITTLSPQTYINYYIAGRSYREINIIDTWMCWGDNSYFKQICNNPREESTEPKEILEPL